MISLVQLLREAQGSPKAVILAGAPGAGKGYILRGLDLGGLKTMNVDDIYVPLLKKANVSLDSPLPNHSISLPLSTLRTNSSSLMGSTPLALNISFILPDTST